MQIQETIKAETKTAKSLIKLSDLIIELNSGFEPSCSQILATEPEPEAKEPSEMLDSDGDGD